MDDRDIIDELVDEWRQQRPELSDEAFDAMTTISRLTRIGMLLAPLIERTFAAHDIARGEFDVLGTLLRQGPPYMPGRSHLENKWPWDWVLENARVRQLRTTPLGEPSLTSTTARS